MTIIETAKPGGANPETCLIGIVIRVAGRPTRRFDQLLPWNWRDQKAPHVKAAQTGRIPCGEMDDVDAALACTPDGPCACRAVRGDSKVAKALFEAIGESGN